MSRATVIGTCLGLCLANCALAQQLAPRSETVTVERVAEVPVRTVQSSRGRSVFSYPSGLSQSAECLFGCLGQHPTNCVPMTSETTFDLGYACFIRGWYSDAIIFAKRGLELRNDARLQLLKGVSEMCAGRCNDAEATAQDYLDSVNAGNQIGLEIARERINGPMRVRFDQILKHISPARPASPAVFPVPAPGV